MVNRYLQAWGAHNLFVMGASVFPQQHGYNPTGTVGALAYWSANAITSQYLKKPGAAGSRLNGKGGHAAIDDATLPLPSWPGLTGKGYVIGGGIGITRRAPAPS
ncbi:MAG: GMC oxidoreductase [Pseudomonadota bacterium]